ncbi:MAG: hypothetical protein M3N54_04175, partial [Acidobacteriota bacterium]|nr:hypothetical protein [Acidobacteriota bacterium]
MVEEKMVAAVEVPSKRAIVKATLIALAAALVILFVAVLPAEYAIDPLRTGAALGLIGLSKASDKANEKTAAARATPVQTGIFTAQPETYRTDSEDLALEPGEGVEIKYHMQKGAGMVYGWKATAKVQFEFPGEPDQKPNPDYFESYELNDKAGADHSYGSSRRPQPASMAGFGKTRARPWFRSISRQPAFTTPQRCMSTGIPRTCRSKTQINAHNRHVSRHGPCVTLCALASDGSHRRQPDCRD